MSLGRDTGFERPGVLKMLADLFDTSKLFERVTLTNVQSEKMATTSVLKDKMALKAKRPKCDIGTDQAYAEQYQKEEEKILKITPSHCVDQSQSTEVDMDTENPTEASSIPLLSLYKPKVVNEVTTACNISVYSRYDFQHQPASALPIEEFKGQILNMVENYPAVVIQGHTGCGKSTQVPQYFLDDCHKNRRPCNIIVTQPRRIAAISLAKRVSYERNWPLGKIVGYKIGQHSAVSEDTRITYCTTGVLLQILVNEKDLNKFTHIIIDEVHERGQELDFLMLIVRKFLRTNSQQVKVILMSATFNCEKFSKYFSANMFKEMCSAPVITIFEKNKYKVYEYYLEHMRQFNTDVENDMEHIQVSNNHHRLAVKIIKKFDELDNSEFEVKWMKGMQNVKSSRGAVLVFLPGIFEIEELYGKLYRERREYKWVILPLHSTITTDEQAAVFTPCEEGYRKIILSTNIAESSITVPDITYVIDYCMTKQLVKDEMSNFTTLELAWASKTNCIQRSGRVGRVAEGRVYRLMAKCHYDSLATEQVPEILRCPLTRLVLMAKVLDSCPPKNLLALAVEPPDLTNIQDTVLQLKEAGALLRTLNGVYSTEDGDLTFLGQVMARLPVDICVA